MRTTLKWVVAVLLVGVIATASAQTYSSAVDATKSAGTKASVSHKVYINIPAIMMLRIQGGSGVSFSPSMATLAGLVESPSSTPLAPTSSTFQEVDAFTNLDGGGPSVTVSVSTPTGVTNPADISTDIELKTGGTYGQANNAKWTLTTNGWTKLWTAGDFGLNVTSSMLAGSYTYQVDYTIANP